MSDKELVDLTLQGEVEAFSALVMRYQNALHGLCYYFLRDFEEAREMAQEAFIRAYIHLPELKEPEKFKEWLKQIAVNLCKMRLRSRASLRRRVGESVSLDSPEARSVPDPFFRPDEELERREMEEIVKEALNKLPPKSQQILILFYIDGLSYREIAEFLDLPLSTVKWRLHQSRNLLREEVLEMMEKGFLKQGAGSEQVERVYRVVCEEEPFELDLATRPGEPIVIFAGLSQMRFKLSGWEEEKVLLKGRKILLGSSAEDARMKSDRIQVFLRRCESFQREVFGRDMELVAGAAGPPDELTLSYIPMGEMLRHLLDRMEESWPGLHREVVQRLEGGCVSVELLENRPEPLWIPASIVDEELETFFSAWARRDDLMLGTSASMDISLHIPNGHPTVIFSTLTGYIEISNFEGEITLIGDSVISKAHNIKGKLSCFGGFIEEIKELEGELSIFDDGFHRGVEWGEVVRRVGEKPVMEITDVKGEVEIRLKEGKVRMERVFGKVKCQNEFGDVELRIEGFKPGYRYELSSATGDVTVMIPDSLKGKLKLSLESEDGELDYKRWDELEYTFNNPWLIYAGSVPRGESERADLRVRTAVGSIILRPMGRGPAAPES